MLFTQCCVLASGLQYDCRRVHYITWECVLDFSGTHACLEAVMMVMQALWSVLPAYFIMIYKESSKFWAVHFFILFVVCESVCPTTKGISISLNSLCSISCWYSLLCIFYPASPVRTEIPTAGLQTRSFLVCSPAVQSENTFTSVSHYYLYSFPILCETAEHLYRYCSLNGPAGVSPQLTLPFSLPRVRLWSFGCL